MQLCIVHMIRSSTRLIACEDRRAVCAALKPALPRRQIVTVEAPDAFIADGVEYRLFEGMQGTLESKVRAVDLALAVASQGVAALAPGDPPSYSEGALFDLTDETQTPARSSSPSARW